jgi:uncharacterized protein YhhL (DUF1145 family)
MKESFDTLTYKLYKSLNRYIGMANIELNLLYNLDIVRLDGNIPAHSNIVTYIGKYSIDSKGVFHVSSYDCSRSRVFTLRNQTNIAAALSRYLTGIRHLEPNLTEISVRVSNRYSYIVINTMSKRYYITAENFPKTSTLLNETNQSITSELPHLSAVDASDRF